MANVLSLALRVTADASRLKLDPVQRALVGLGDQADKLTSQFAKFAGGSDAAAKAQDRFGKEAQDLINTLRDGGSATQFAAGFERLTEAVNKEAAAFERAARITEANLTPLERFDRAQAELKEQLDAGRISLETYARATESAAKGLTNAERAARGLAVQQKSIDNAAAGTTLKFNELSGVFSALPGPLGNISGRISGITSASEGLSRIFSGGLSQGFSGIASSVTSLVNPLTLAIGGIAAFGAGAAAIVRGLAQLEDRVEKLGNTADKLGVSFEFIQTLEEAANRSGTSIDAVSSAFGRLQKSVLGVDEESKAAQRALDEIGVTAEELQRLDPAAQYQRIGTALAAIEDPARRTATATALFGKAGSELIPFFNNLESAQQDLQTFGATLTTAQRGQIDRLGAAFDQVGVSLKSLGQSVLTPFIGIVEGVAKTFSGLVNVVTGVAQALGTILGPVLNGIGLFFGELGDAINGFVGLFRGFLGSTENATAQTQALAAAAKEVKVDPQPVREYEKALLDVNAKIQEANRESVQFGESGKQAAAVFSATVAQLRDQFESRAINEATFKREVETATQAYEQQIGVVRQLSEETRRRAEAERQAVQSLIDDYERAARVTQQFNGNEAAASAAERLTIVYAEAERVERQLQEARRGGDEEATRGLQERLETLAAIAIREEDIASGAAAAREQQRRDAQAAVDERERLERDARDRRIQAERQAEQQLANERQRVNNLVNEQLALAQFGGDSQRLAAARNVQAIQAEIARVEAEVEKARQAGNAQAAQAGAARIAQLDQVAAKERDIASGRAQKEAEIARRREEAAAREKQLSEQFARQREQAVQQQQAAAKQQQEAQQKAFEEQARAAAAEAERQERRIASLNTVASQVTQGADIRSTEGARQFLAAAAGAFDPNLAELKAQTKLLRQIVLNSGFLQYLEQGIGRSVQILRGGA